MHEQICYELFIETLIAQNNIGGLTTMTLRLTILHHALLCTKNVIKADQPHRMQEQAQKIRRNHACGIKDINPPMAS